jgi:hypothetical protein
LTTSVLPSTEMTSNLMTSDVCVAEVTCAVAAPAMSRVIARADRTGQEALGRLFMIPLLIVLFTWIAIEIDVADVMQRHDGVD